MPARMAGLAGDNMGVSPRTAVTAPSHSPARCIMVLGTTSGAGKSWLATALCRHYSDQGLKVAPFKAQNMSNNARVVATPEGGYGEIGSAQYFQALAARAVPDVRMNPLLLKPEADTKSQVVLMGQVSDELSQLPWRGRSARVWPRIAAALDELRAENDVVVIEGAGSPAEINLHASDVVNMRVARHADARCLLVADIDRGGAFAHLYGTWALLPEEERALIRGFVLNKFRGDAALLAPAPELLREKTGVPVVATIPMQWDHGLPEEDGVFDIDMAPTLGTGVSSLPPEGALAARGGPSPLGAHASGAVHTRIAVVAYPRISNLDEFQPLRNVPGVRLSWARSPAEVEGADWIVLPGSKATASDLAWLRARGMDGAIARHAAAGGRVLGICGGLQMLGEALVDVHGVEPGGSGPGLGLLPLVTRFEPVKTLRRGAWRFGEVAGAWAPLSGVAFGGYEIHSGQTVQHPAMVRKGDVAREVVTGLAWQNAAGNVLGCYVHGLLEDAAVLRALFGSGARSLDDVFDGLAAQVQRAFAPGVLDALMNGE